MKKQLLFSFLIGMMAVYTFAQDRIIDDFEDASSAFFLDGGRMMGEIVNNPDVSGINTSSKVLKIMPNPTSVEPLWGEDLAVYANQAFNFQTHPVLSFKVYVDDSSIDDTIGIAARFDNGTRWEQYMFSHEFPWNGNAGEWTFLDADQGKWTELTWDLSKIDGISGYSKFLLTLTDTSADFKTLYVDDVKMIERIPAYEESTKITLFYDPVTTVPWVGDWAGGTAASDFAYRVVKNGYSPLNTDTLTISTNAYDGSIINDNIEGSSGGAAYILTAAATKSASLTFPIPTNGAGSLSLEFDMAVTGKAYTSGLAPKVEVKYDAGDWQAVTLTNLPDADTTWTTVSADLASTGDVVSIRFTNEIAASIDTMEFRIDDITLLGTQKFAESIDVKGEDDLTVVTLTGALQMFATIDPVKITNADIFWYVDDESIATISNKGLLTGVSTGSVWVYAMVNDGSGVKDSIQISSEDIKINIETITVSSDVESISAESAEAQMFAVVKPANATDKTYAWSTDNANFAVVDETGLVTATGDGTVSVIATANDAGAVTGTKSFTVTGFTSSVNEARAQSIGLYPNPVSGILNIQSDITVQNVQIITLDGRMVISDNTGASTLNVETLNAGLYIVNVVDADGTIYQAKFVKE